MLSYLMIRCSNNNVIIWFRTLVSGRIQVKKKVELVQELFLLVALQFDSV
jgi:hypothetical protein